MEVGNHAAERTRQIPNARKCACPTNSVGPIAGLLEAARNAVGSSRRDARLEAHLQPVWNVFGDFLEIFPKGYGATVLIAACLFDKSHERGTPKRRHSATTRSVLAENPEQLL